jgi:putative glutamine amidotransferase
MSSGAAGRLKIGLSACFQHADPARSLFTGKTLQYVEQSIAHWIMSTGAMVVMVPCPTGETQRGDVKLAHYAEWLDGVVMHGGADVWPGSYGEEPLKDAWIGDRIRDLYDLALVEAFEQAGKPIFGVCRGLQLINVAFGGTLYQDIETQHPDALRHRDAVAYDHNFHEIEFVQGSRLAQMYPGLRRARVNSIHHQGIKGLAPGFEIEAWSYPDRVPEAIRRRSARGNGYIAATQWHPEFHKAGLDTVDDTAILEDFLSACAAARARPARGRRMPGQIRDRASRLLRQALLRAQRLPRHFGL